MGIKLRLQADGTTSNFNQGTIRAEGFAENTGNEPVSLYPGQINVELFDADGRPMPVELQGRGGFEEQTLMPGDRMDLAMELLAPDIRLGQPFQLKAWWQGIDGEGSTPVNFRPIEPGP